MPEEKVPRDWTPAGRVTLVLRLPTAESLWLAEVGYGQGLRSIEVTRSTPDWRQTLEALRRELPEVEIGVGSLLEADHLREAHDAGADFLVTPALVTGAAGTASDLGLPLIQGAATPSEVLRAHLEGSTLVKVFPASRLGGPAYLRDLLAPMPSLRLVPSGGIGAADVREYLAAGAAAVSLGSGIASREQRQARDEAAIARAFEEALKR